MPGLVESRLALRVARLLAAIAGLASAILWPREAAIAAYRCGVHALPCLAMDVFIPPPEPAANVWKDAQEAPPAGAAHETDGVQAEAAHAHRGFNRSVCSVHIVFGRFGPKVPKQQRL